MSRSNLAPVVTCARHRMQLDGQGVTTLVCFRGCPLRCQYCLNPFTLSPETRYTNMTPEELYQRVKVDDLYFVATGGGVTFGGGEPLLYPDFIQEFAEICGSQWHICIETSLNIPWENVETVSRHIDMFYIDCKDTDPDIYRRYTGRNNAQMLENLAKLAQLIPQERIVVRVPLIPGYNTQEDRERTQQRLTALGVVNFDFFEYTTKKHDFFKNNT